MSQQLTSLLFVLTFIVVGVFYILSLQDFIKIISPPNRRMQPNMLWLIFIPVFNFIWHFIIVYRISESVNLELSSKNQKIESRLVDSIGFIASTLWTLGFILNIAARSTPALEGITPIIGIGTVITWIVYWIKLILYKKELKRILTI